MADQKLRLVIDLVSDKAQAALKLVGGLVGDLGKIGRQSANGINQVITALTGGDAGGALAGLRATITGVTSSLGGLRTAAAGGGSGLGVFAAGAGIAVGAVAALATGVAFAGKAAVDMVGHYGDAAEATVNLADRVGLTVSQTEKFVAMARIAGVNAGVLEGSAVRLAQGLEDTGTSGDRARKALRELGVETQDATGKQRELGPVLLDVLKSLQKVETDTQRTTLATALLGRGAKELTPLIKGYEDLADAVAKLNIGENSGLTKSVASAGDEIDKLSLAWEEFKKNLAGKIAPIVIPVIVTRLTDGLNAMNKGQSFTGNPLDFATNLGVLSSIARGQQPQKTNGYLPTMGFLPQINEDPEVTAGRRAADAYLKSRAASLDGLKKQDAQLREELAEIDRKVSAGGLSAKTVAEMSAKAKALESDIKGVQGKIEGFGLAKDAAKKAAEEFKQSGDLIRDLILDLSTKGLDPLAQLLIETRKKLAEIVAKRGGALLSDPDAAGLSTGLQAALKAARKPVELATISNTPGGFGIGDFQIQAAVDAARRGAQAGLAGLAGESTIGNNARELEVARQALDYQQRKIELMTGPGGEYAASQQIIAVQLDGLEKRKALGEDIAQIELDRTRIIQDAELRTLQLQRDRFNDIKSQAGQVFDSLTRDARNFGSVLLNILKTALLTPIRDAASTVIATILTGGGGQRPAAAAGGGFGGLLGGLGSIFTGGRGILSGLGGFGSATAPGGTSTFTGASIGGGTGGGGFGLSSLGGLFSGGGGRGALGALGGAGGLLATGGIGTLLGGLTTKNRTLGSILTIGGGAALGTQLAVGGTLLGAVGGAGIGLFADGLRRGGWAGFGETTAGGAIVGARLGGPVGALIGAGVGATAGLVRMLFKGATSKAKDLIAKRYGITIEDSGILQQIVAMAKNYGGNLSWAIDQADIRQIIELYGLMTSGSRGSNPVKTMQSYSFVQNGASIIQSVGGGVGTGLSYSAQPPDTNVVIVPVNFEDVFAKETVNVVARNGNVVQQASLDATKRNYGRREQAGRLFAPNLMLSGSPT